MRKIASSVGAIVLGLGSLKAPETNNQFDTLKVPGKVQPAAVTPTEISQTSPTQATVEKSIAFSFKSGTKLTEIQIITNAELTSLRTYLDSRGVLDRQDNLKVPFSLNYKYTIPVGTNLHKIGFTEVVVKKGEGWSNVKLNLRRSCPPGTTYFPVVEKSLHPNDIITAKLIFSADNIRLENISANARKTIQEIFSLKGEYSDTIHSLFYSNSFAKLSEQHQEEISKLVKNFYKPENPTALDELSRYLSKIITDNPSVLFDRAESGKTIYDAITDFQSSKTQIKYDKLSIVTSIFKAISKTEGGIVQGNKGTCVASSLCLAFADKYPADFATISAKLFENGCFNTIGEDREGNLKIEAPKTINLSNDTRNYFNKFIGDAFMEAVNGSAEYNSELDVNLIGGKKVGRGAELEKLPAVLNALVNKKDYVSYHVDPSRLQLSDLDRLLKKGAVLFGVKWRTHSEEEITMKLKETGGTRDSIFGADGRSNHALALAGVDHKTNEVICFTSWTSEGHANREAGFVYSGDSTIRTSFANLQERLDIIVAKKDDRIPIVVSHDSSVAAIVSNIGSGEDVGLREKICLALFVVLNSAAITGIISRLQYFGVASRIKDRIKYRSVYKNNND